MAKSIAEMEMDSYDRAYCESLYIEETTDGDYIVSNLDHNTSYIVSTEGEFVISCDCPHHIYRQVNCKHMTKVAIETGKQLI